MVFLTEGIRLIAVVIGLDGYAAPANAAQIVDVLEVGAGAPVQLYPQPPRRSGERGRHAERDFRIGNAEPSGFRSHGPDDASADTVHDEGSSVHWITARSRKFRRAISNDAPSRSRQYDRPCRTSKTGYVLRAVRCVSKGHVGYRCRWLSRWTALPRRSGTIAGFQSFACSGSPTGLAYRPASAIAAATASRFLR